jgi:hypothetical protein
MREKTLFVVVVVSLVVVSLFVLVIGIGHLATSFARAREVEESITASNEQMMKEMVVVNFLQGHEINRAIASWLDTTSSEQMTEVKLLLQNKEISELVPGDDPPTKAIVLHKLLYHEFVVQLPEDNPN